MARPAEKARAMLNKWVALREKGNNNQGPAFGDNDARRRRRRPHLASECQHLADAERYRGQILHEIAQAIAKIQNPALPEHDVRELNDDINRKLREKWHWNKRIVELGGLDFNAIERQRQVEEGDLLQQQGYRYFGEAKKLPGVPELLAKEEERLQKRSLQQRDWYKMLTPDYYGWRDEEDGVLLELEALATQQMKQVTMDTNSTKQRRTKEQPHDGMDEDRTGALGVVDYLSHVPSQDEVAQRRLKIKKAALLQQYGL